MPDPIRSAFDELTAAVDSAVRPPGVAAVRRTVRRRRQQRWAGGGAALAVLAVVGAVALLRPPAGEQPAADLTLRATTPVTAASAMKPRPTPPPSVAPTAQPTPPASPDRPGGATRAPTIATTSKIPVPLPPGCARDGRTWRVTTGSTITITARSICPGETARVFWATYETRPDGSHVLFASEQHTLTAEDPSVTTTLRRSTECEGPWFVVVGEAAVLSAIAEDDATPYPDGVIASGDGEICLN